MENGKIIFLKILSRFSITMIMKTFIYSLELLIGQIQLQKAFEPMAGMVKNVVLQQLRFQDIYIVTLTKNILPIPEARLSRKFFLQVVC
jgi:hypothetical protein